MAGQRVAAPGDLRQYLLTQFNQALRRLGMYGGEDALLLLAGALASVYAEAALPYRWVTLDRALDRREYDDLDRSSGSWAGQDRTLTEVLATFGPPSICFGGTNPYYPKTLGYTTAPTVPASPTAPQGPHSLICFHLWNHPQPANAPHRAVHDEPILLPVRHPSHPSHGPGPGHPGPGYPFADRFTFTPAGARHRHPEY